MNVSILSTGAVLKLSNGIFERIPKEKSQLCS